MKKTYRTKQETIKYFRQVAFEYEKEAHRNGDKIAKEVARGKAEAYELAAFHIEKNME
jgi:hypothetical protein